MAILGAPTVALFFAGRSFPPDTTPEGAYLRIVLAVTSGKLGDAFAYLETEAQWGVFTLLDYGRKAYELVVSAYPEPERTAVLPKYAAAHTAKDGPAFFAQLAAQRGYERRLRKDLSGHKSVEIVGDRATVETARGTRYPFRRRENGIWGLTLFTADLKAEAERAARDFGVVEAAASDYRGR